MAAAAKQFLRTISQAGLMLACLAVISCGARDDNWHTTATTYVAPPPRQVLTVAYKPGATNVPPEPTVPVDTTEPHLELALENRKLFHLGEDVPIAFFVSNAKLKGDGGEFRLRYIVDDEEMKWIDKAEPFWLSGWTPGKHTIRLELIGPDGWPYRNNVVTREIEVK